MKDEDFRLLVGQTWDVISPLVSRHVAVLGRLGRRQHRLPPGTSSAASAISTFSDISLVTAQLSINQQVFADSTATPRTSPAKPPNWPIVEGRVAWTVGQRGPGCLPITVGLSGHIGE